MKYFILLNILIGVVHSKLSQQIVDDWNAVQNPYIEQCVKETKVDPSLPGRVLKDLHFPEERSFQCYIKCVMEKLKVILSNDFNINILARVVHLSQEIAEKCVNLSRSEDDLCVRAYNVVTCSIQSKIN